MAASRRPKHPGIEIRHSQKCPAGSGSTRCSCSPRYRAFAFSAREGKLVRKTFTSLTEAKAWRTEAQVALRRGTMTAAPTPTLGDAAEAWLAGAESGAIRNRSGDEYKPSAIRGYEQALRLRLLPEFETVKLSEISRGELQAFIDRLLEDGANPSTIRNTLMPLRSIFRRAVARGEVPVNPTNGLEMPAVRGSRDRVASREEAELLLAALPADQALWATAIYSGLRHGELRALEVDDVDLKKMIIHVRRSWDPYVGPITTKSRAGRRNVFLSELLEPFMREHLATLEWSDGLVFGRSAEVPFSSCGVNNRAYAAWERAELNRITLHECRHSFASLAIAAGVNAKALSEFMGHASVAFTWDRYGHLMPGNEKEASGLFDAYLRRAQGA